METTKNSGEPLRLAIVTHNVIKGDGQGRANYEIARYALKHGVRVSLFADEVDEELVSEGAEWVRIVPPSPWRKANLLKVMMFAREADKLLHARKGEFDIIHGYGYCLGIPHDINTSQFVHSAWRKSPAHTARQHKNLYGLYQWTYSAMNAAWEKKAYLNARVVVAASSTVREELKELGVAPQNLRVILNGADLAEFYPGAADRKTLGLPEGVPLGLFAGDLRTPRKNLDTVLKAIALAPGVHLAVVGKTEGSPFPALAQSLNIADRVHFLGFRRDIAQIMRACDVFVFPSRYEACALVLAEAIASGMPVVTAQTTGGSELIEPEWGVCVPDSNDENALADALLSITGASGEKRTAMGQAARKRAERNGWDDVCQSYLELYHEVAAKPVPVSKTADDAAIRTATAARV